MLSKILNILKSDELKGKFSRGGIILAGGSVFDYGLRFVRNIVLARLLAPQYFGLMAIILSAISVSHALTEVGIRQAVIQNKAGASEEFLNVAWWFSFAIGLFLFLVAVFASPFISEFYKHPELALPLGLTFSTIIFDCVLSPRLHVLEKELQYFRWILVMQGPAVINVVIAVTFSLFYQSIWPLVIAKIAERGFIFILSYWVFPFRPRLSINRTYFQELFLFTKRMFGLPIIATMFFQLDIFVAGRFVPMEKLGMYSLARTAALIPVNAFATIVRPLMLAVFSKLQDDHAAMRKWLFRAVEMTAVAVLPLAAGLIVVSRPFLAILYGAPYGEVYLAFSILMLFVIARILSVVFMQLFIAFGRPDLQRQFSIVRLLLALAVIYPAVRIFGIEGAAATIFFGMGCLLLMQIVWSRRLIDFEWGRFIRTFIHGSILALLVGVCGVLFRQWVSHDGVTLGFMATIYFAAVAWGSWYFVVKNKILDDEK